MSAADDVVATTHPTDQQAQSWSKTHIGSGLVVYHRRDLTPEFLSAISQHVTTIQATSINVSEFIAYGPPSYRFTTRGRKAGGR